MHACGRDVLFEPRGVFSADCVVVCDRVPPQSTDDWLNCALDEVVLAERVLAVAKGNAVSRQI